MNHAKQSQEPTLAVADVLQPMSVDHTQDAATGGSYGCYLGRSSVRAANCQRHSVSAICCLQQQQSCSTELLHHTILQCMHMAGGPSSEEEVTQAHCTLSLCPGSLVTSSSAEPPALPMTRGGLAPPCI